MATDTLLSPPPELANAITPSVSSVQTTDRAATQILTRSFLTGGVSGGGPSYLAHVQAAWAVATQWVSEVRPLVVPSLQGVIDWDTTFNALVEPLSADASQIAQGDDTAVADFTQQLAGLQSSTDGVCATVATLRPALTGYLSRVQAAARDLAADQVANQAAVDAVNAERNQLSGEINQLKTKHHQTKKDRDEESCLNAQLETSYGTLYVASTLLFDNNTYLGYTQNLAVNLGTLLAGWEILASNLATLRASEDIDDFDVFTQDELAAVSADWTVAAQLARAVLGSFRGPDTAPAIDPRGWQQDAPYGTDPTTWGDTNNHVRYAVGFFSTATNEVVLGPWCPWIPCDKYAQPTLVDIATDPSGQADGRFLFRQFEGYDVCFLTSLEASTTTYVDLS